MSAGHDDARCPLIEPGPLIEPVEITVAVGQLAQPVDVHVLVRTEHQQDDREPEADLGGSDRDHEQGEHLTRVQRVVPPGVERDQVEVDRVEHQLDPHQHEHRVPSREDDVHADAEQHR